MRFRQPNSSSCDEYKIHLHGQRPLHLHVKINQNHVRPISVKTTFPLMNSPITHQMWCAAFFSAFILLKCAFQNDRPEWGRDKWRGTAVHGKNETNAFRPRFMHNYSLLHTKCLVFKSEIWAYRQDVCSVPTDVWRCLRDLWSAHVNWFR